MKQTESHKNMEKYRYFSPNTITVTKFINLARQMNYEHLSFSCGRHRMKCNWNNRMNSHCGSSSRLIVFGCPERSTSWLTFSAILLHKSRWSWFVWFDVPHSSVFNDLRTNSFLWTAFPMHFYCLLTRLNRSFLERRLLSRLVNKSPAFYGTRSYITVFTLSVTCSHS